MTVPVRAWDEVAGDCRGVVRGDAANVVRRGQADEED